MSRMCSSKSMTKCITAKICQLPPLQPTEMLLFHHQKIDYNQCLSVLWHDVTFLKLNNLHHLHVFGSVFPVSSLISCPNHLNFRNLVSNNTTLHSRSHYFPTQNIGPVFLGAASFGPKFIKDELSPHALSV